MQHICVRSPNDPIVEGCDANHAPMRQCGEGHIVITLFDLYHALLDVHLILLDLYPTRWYPFLFDMCLFPLCTYS